MNIQKRFEEMDTHNEVAAAILVLAEAMQDVADSIYALGARGAGPYGAVEALAMEVTKVADGINRVADSIPGPA